MTIRALLPMVLVGMFTACSGFEPIAEQRVQQVDVVSVDLAGRLWDPFLPPIDTGDPVTVSGSLTIPPTDVPVPAVVIEHGCGGVGAGERDWSNDLAEVGIASLVLDSFTGREIDEVCSGVETVNVASIVVDVYRAADVLRENPAIDGSRVAVMGLSFGGRTALWSSQVRFQQAYGGDPFAAYVAFYPSTCYIELLRETDVAGGPIRIFHGTADDWVPIEPCRAYVDRLSAAGVDAAINAYPGALHAFDNRSFGWAVALYDSGLPSPRRCRFIERDGTIVDPDTGAVAGVGSPCVERGVTFGYDAEARRVASADLVAFLVETFAMR